MLKVKEWFNSGLYGLMMAKSAELMVTWCLIDGQMMPSLTIDGGHNG